MPSQASSKNTDTMSGEPPFAKPIGSNLGEEAAETGKETTSPLSRTGKSREVHIMVDLEQAS